MVHDPARYVLTWKKDRVHSIGRVKEGDKGSQGAAEQFWKQKTSSSKIEHHNCNLTLTKKHKSADHIAVVLPSLCCSCT